MVRRHKKKSRKYLGRRTWGKGNTKNKRGAGNRGGRGRAGVKKHKFLMFIKERFQKEKRKKYKVIDFSVLNKWIEQNKFKKEGDYFIVDLTNKKFKLLNKGDLKYKIKYKGILSNKAKEEILNKGGEVI